MGHPVVVRGGGSEKASKVTSALSKLELKRALMGSVSTQNVTQRFSDDENSTIMPL